MNIQELTRSSWIRAVIEAIRADPNYSISQENFERHLTLEQRREVQKKQDALDQERSMLQQPHLAMTEHMMAWHNRRVELLRDIKAWEEKRDKRRKRNEARVAWLYKSYRVFNERAAQLALEFQGFSDDEKARFVMPADPHYHGSNAILTVALPLLRSGFEDRPDLFNTRRTARLAVLSDALAELENKS